ncbi:integrin alpha-PS2 isoform X2 [Coccinella septempunctata]|uniref:integrin alpha-PS2 isoform X2 n=1 Tax=Coccinella septempunctata TaxID=41139 RepID=UPI001D07B48C|nr:integrin alpha-PS2 isoform X2 [Coccinella septempunctata]
MCQCDFLFSVVLLTCYVLTVTCFNIESFHYAVYGPPDKHKSMFGFTVGLHKERNTGWILIGAPEGQSRYQPVRTGGVVYRCPIDRDESCEEIPFDTKGNNIRDGSDIDQKDGQWFGATLSTSGRNNGPIVACAPRYVWYALTKKRRDPVGTCYVSNGAFTSFEEYSPCRTSQWGYHRQGSCQAGFSAAINEEGDRLFIGAPGSWYWQGQMYSVDAKAKFVFTPGLFSRFGGKGQVIQQSIETRPAVFSTKEGLAKDDDSYLGYSIVKGDFAGTGVEGVAVGMPRGANLHGKVLLYTWDLTNFKNFSGDQLGSYFGYALASVDVDGDKKDDIVIGAPMYTIPNNEGKYEVGRVYVIYHGGFRGTFSSSYVIEGFQSKSRFGHALAGLGDINQDGYGDFAVGAPYDGSRERGAVYIYHGSEKGVRKTFSQVIHAEDISYGPSIQPNLALGNHPETFGFSLTGGIDLDGNDYPDFAVGSYLSDKAFFFRSRPVVRVEAFVRFLTPGKQIDIKDESCTLSNGKKVACTSIDFCVKYSGKGIPASINLEVQYILDTRQPKRPRMSFLEHENINSMNNTIRLEKDRGDTCETKKIYLRPDLYDKLTALEAEVKYWMREEDNSERGTREARDPNSILTPILDLNSPPVRKDSIIIQKNCGPDNVCIPNLSIEITPNVQQYLFGSKENLNFTIIVNNNGEDSFGTTFSLVYPDGIYFKKVDDKSQQHATCRNSENRTLNCDIGNPLPAGNIVKFDVILQPYYKEGLEDTFEFDMYVNSTNPELKKDVKDNHQHISIAVWADSNIELRGVSHPPELYFNETLYPNDKIYKEEDIGPQVIHTYFLRNLGPANIEETELLLSWPYATLEGESFLYLIEQPHTLGNVKCHHVPEANYLNLSIEENFSWERINVKESSIEFHSVLSGGSVSLETDAITKGVTGGAVITPSQEDITSLVGGSEDISVIDQQRHNTSASTTGAFGGVTTTTYSEYETQIINGVPSTIVTNTTTVRDAKGNVLNTYVRKGNSNHHVGVPQRNSQGTSKVEGGKITTTYTKYETKIVNGVPVTTVTNTTTISDAVTGEILSSNTVSEGSTSHVLSTGRTSGGSYYENTASGGINNLNSYPIDGKPIVNRIEGTNYSITNQGITQSGRVFQWDKNGGGRQEGRTYQTDYRIGPPMNQPIPDARTYEKTNSGEVQSRTEYRQNTTGYSGNAAYGFYDAENKDASYESEYLEPTEEGDQSQTGYFDEEGIYHSYAKATSGDNSNDSYVEQNGFSRGSIEFNQDLGNLAANKGFTTTFSQVGSGSEMQVGSIGQGAGREKVAFTEEVTLTATYDPDTGRFIPDSRQDRSSRSKSQSRKSSSRKSDSSKIQTSHSSASGSSFSKQEHWSNSKSVSSPQNSIEMDNVPTNRPTYRYMGRKKRQATYHHRTLHYDKAMLQAIQCHSTKCFHVRCVVGRLAPEKEVVVAFRGRISAKVLKNVTDHSIKFSSMMAAKITKLPFFGKTDKTNVTTFEIETNVPGPPPEIKSDVVPLWIILLSAIVGTLILLLAVLLLYKLGFFKRNRPSSAPERQPLNRNGYHHGDEAL